MLPEAIKYTIHIKTIIIQACRAAVKVMCAEKSLVLKLVQF